MTSTAQQQEQQAKIWAIDDEGVARSQDREGL